MNRWLRATISRARSRQRRKWPKEKNNQEKINNLKNMLGGRYMKTLEDIKNKMIKEAREMMEGGMKDKEIKQKINELLKFHYLTMQLIVFHH